MRRTTIMLPETLKARAEDEAKKQGISFGAYVREALKEALESPVCEDPLFADRAVYDGDAPEDLSLKHDRYVYGEEP